MQVCDLVPTAYLILIWHLFCKDTTLTAAKLGHHQVLWLFGPNHELTEVGAMNIFVVYINEQGGKNIILNAAFCTLIVQICRKYDTIVQIITIVS